MRFHGDAAMQLAPFSCIWLFHMLCQYGAAQVCIACLPVVHQLQQLCATCITIQVMQ
jgi:hypothetical protein